MISFTSAIKIIDLVAIYVIINKNQMKTKIIGSLVANYYYYYFS